MTVSQKSTAYSIHKHWLCDCFTKITCMFNSLTAGLIHKNQLYAWFMSTDYVTDSQKISCVLDSQVLTAGLIHQNQLHAGFNTDCMTDSQKSTSRSIHKHWRQNWFTKINCVSDSPALTPSLCFKPAGNGHFAARFPWLDLLPPVNSPSGRTSPCQRVSVVTPGVPGHRAASMPLPVQAGRAGGRKDKEEEMCTCAVCIQDLLKLQVN